MNQSESWTYDGMNHVLSHTDRKGQATLYSYDALNRRSLVSYADGSTTQPTYDAANRLTSLADSSSGTLSWGYDGLDRMTSAVTPQATVSYAYDAADRRTSMTPAAQAIVNYAFGDVTQVTRLAGMSNATTTQFTYTSDYSQLASVSAGIDLDLCQQSALVMRIHTCRPWPKGEASSSICA